MRKMVGFVSILTIAACGYGVADLCDVVPGLFTFKPLENLAHPYPSIKATEEAPPSLSSSKDAPMPDSAKVQEIIDTLSDASVIGGSDHLGMYVVDAQTGAELGAHNQSVGKVPASTMKVVTSYAALSSLGADHRFTTRALLSGQNLYLVGGGDILLGADSGDSKHLVGHAGIADLAHAAAEKLAASKIDSVKVFLDNSRYSEDKYGPGVHEDVIYTLPSSPIAVGYEGDPFEAQHAVDRVLDTFVDHLRAAGVTVETAGVQTAPKDAQDIAHVDSASVRAIADFTLLHSDNALADTLQHEIAVASGKIGSFETGSAAVTEQLQTQGFDLSGVSITDGSGLSPHNRLTPKLLTQILRAVWTCDSSAEKENTKENTQGKESDDVKGCPATQIGAGMPFAGLDGTLKKRFTNSSATGRVHAKTGNLTGVRTLAGYLYTAQGRPLVFAILVNTERPGSEEFDNDVLPAIDDAVNALASL